MSVSIGLKPCTLVYIILILLTLFTWYVGLSGLSGLTISFLVLGLSLLKGQFIGDYYMELQKVSSAWRWVIVVWLLVPGSLIAIAFYITES